MERQRPNENERRRSLVVLVIDFLQASGYLESSARLQTEANISLKKVQAADNVDLLGILQEYEQYYALKFGKPPKLVRKGTNEAIPVPPSGPPRRHSPPPRYKSNDDLPFYPENPRPVLPKLQKKSSASRLGHHSFSGGSAKEDAKKDSRGKAVNGDASCSVNVDGISISGTSVVQREVSSVALDTGDQNNNLESNVSILVSFPLTILDKLQPSDDLYEHRLLKPLPFFENSEYRELAAIITRDIYVQNPHVKWSDIAGLSLSKRLVREAVVYPLKYPHLFTGILKPWSGILLYGPPGTGKTMLAKAVATECETTFFNISASSIVSKWRGDSEKLVRTLFELARYHAPSTIFIDELEAIMGHRTSDGAEHEGSRRMKTELLIQMDGLAKANKGHVFLLAASNLPWDLDVAMLRRLEKRILITVPDEPARRSIFLMHLPPNTTDRTSLLVSDTLDYDLFARMTASYSGSDILSVCKEAAMRPLRQIFERLESRAEGEDVVAGEVEGRPVTTEDVLEALRGTRPSVNAGVCKRYEEWEKESGAS